MTKTNQGIIAQIKNQGYQEGKTQGERNIITQLLKNFPIETVANMLHKDKKEIQKIIKKVD